MSDRYNGFAVVLEKNLKDEDAERTINAIKQIKGVLTVKPNIGSFDEITAAARVKADLARRMWDVIYSEEKQ